MINWKKYLKAKAEDRWDILQKDNRLSYDHVDNWLMSLKAFMEKEILEWCYKNNTIPMKDLLQRFMEGLK